jgi:GAF domain-containing protein
VRKTVVMVDELISVELTPLSEAIAAMAGIVLGESFDDVLARLTEVTKRTVSGAYEVSVTMHERRPATAASTASFAERVDECQYDAGDGPCLEALRAGKTVVVDNQLTESRWPEYSGCAAEAGVRSSVSVPLMVQDRHIAALNIYGDQSEAFSQDAIEAAEALAVYAAVVLANADLYLTATSRAEQMAEAMASRAVIEQAKGVLMGGRRCSADEAFAVLVKLSQQSGRKLREVAQALVDQVESAPQQREG